MLIPVIVSPLVGHSEMFGLSLIVAPQTWCLCSVCTYSILIVAADS